MRPPDWMSQQDKLARDFVRFIRLVCIGEPQDCWTWLGNKPDGLYGHFSVEMRSMKAHRWLYALLHGPIPDGLVVRHKCDNPQCVNPLHLAIGTSADNQRDMHERGRASNRQGENHPLARLTADQVLEIRREASCGTRLRELAARFGITEKYASKIVRRDTWRHI